jgi:hypothetical protein
MKWHAISEMEEERVLYLDADTICFRDPQELFDTCRERVLYAREEFGTHPGHGAQQLGNMLVLPRIDRHRLRAWQRLFGARPAPILNSGVMVFNKGFSKTLAELIPAFESTREMLVARPADFPATNRQIEDEVVAALVFGTLQEFRPGFILKKHSPWYCEWKAGVVSDPGVVMHLWSAHAAFYVLDFEGPEALRDFPYPVRVETRYLAP